MTPTRIAQDTYGGSKSVDEWFVDGRESGMFPPLGLASAHGNKWYTSQQNKNGISFSMPEPGPLPFGVRARRKREYHFQRTERTPAVNRMLETKKRQALLYLCAVTKMGERPLEQVASSRRREEATHLSRPARQVKCQIQQ